MMALFGKKKAQAQQAPCCTSAQPAKAESGGSEAAGGIRSVKVLGAGCKACHEQYKNARAAALKLGLDIEVEYITDMEKVMAYGVMSMPAVVVNEKVASAGKVLKAAELEGLLQRLGA